MELSECLLFFNNQPFSVKVVVVIISTQGQEDDHNHLRCRRILLGAPHFLDAEKDFSIFQFSSLFLLKKKPSTICLACHVEITQRTMTKRRRSPKITALRKKRNT